MDSRPLPDEPLVRLAPVSSESVASADEAAAALDLQLQLIAARVHLAIAEAWDAGRIGAESLERPPFEGEVLGLLGVARGSAPEQVAIARAQVAAIEQRMAEAEHERARRPTPLDLLAEELGVGRVAMRILLAIAAPRLRGAFARLYKILAASKSRPLVDEQLLVQILGDSFQRQIARELDADRPLRRLGVVQVTGDRPNAALAVDPLIVRFVANRPVDSEPDPHVAVRRGDRELEELQLPRELVIDALRFLALPWPEPARIVVRGRVGAGRHALLAGLAARAGRALGVIDIALLPRDGLALATSLETALRRAKLRGHVPCVDGIEGLSADERDARVQVAAVLRRHPGPLALRLPAEAEILLEPGYLLLDLPARTEQQRTESWTIALARHHIALSDPSELAARYRVGPGIVERVCAEVVRRPDPPIDAAGWLRELDDAVRQHVEMRLGKLATRVTRLATWADLVLPEDIVDSLVELTARVRHRRRVFEQWGFERSISTARGITALFQGSPGTGKTMVAGVIARDLGVELYRVDVSRISSRWLGETEKNLGALFDAAEDGQVMLLFDEADTLFAKRTEVKTSADRYANMEVNYLLQRLDSFEGIAILTTNFGSAIDPAFMRRLTYRVTFPFPDEEMREQLWRTQLPPQVPTDGSIDPAALARRFRLSGGYIRNSALRAAFLAAEEGLPLSHSHLERAVTMEFREIGKLAETGVLE